MKLSSSLAVMLVDDNEDDRALIQLAFEQHVNACHVILMPDGQSTLDWLAEARAGNPDRRRPDLILLDLNMPGMDGLTVLRLLMADRFCAMIPIVVLSTSRREQDIEQCYRLGANAYMVKPTGARELAQMIDGFFQYWFGLVTLPTLDDPIASLR